MAPLAPEITPPGDDSFTPSDDKLLSFLRRKIAGEPLPAAGAAAHFHDANIYAADPSLLTTLFEAAPAPAKRGESGPGSSWFFFTRVRPKSSSDSRKSRQVAGGAGTWHSERAPRRVHDGEGKCAGHSQYFCYKRKTGKSCSERTEWYMVELSHDQDQEADHERVHGGEPHLVLCKIYKAHTHSRSGSASASRPSCSASARKRKAVDEASGSAPVKARRRLFDSPAPASAVSLQEQASTKGWIVGEAATSQGKIGGISDWMASMSKSDGDAATSQGKMSDTPDWFPLMSMANDKAATSQQKAISLQEQVSWIAGEAATSQWILGDTSYCAAALTSEADGEAASASQGEIADTSDWIASMSKADGEASTSLGKMISGIPDWFPFMSKGSGEAATSQGNNGDTSDCTSLMSKTDGEAVTSQLKKIGDTSDFSRFWPEPEATFDRGYSMTGGALPNCSMAIVRDVGDLFCGRDAGFSAFPTSDDTTAFVRGMHSAPVLPPGEASWWSGTGTNGVWSC